MSPNHWFISSDDVPVIPAAQMWQNTQIISDSTQVQAIWSSILFDNQGNIASTTSGDMKPIRSGLWKIHYFTEWTGNDTGDRVLYIYFGSALKGTTLLLSNNWKAADQLTIYYYVTASDIANAYTFKAKVYQTSGGNLTLKKSYFTCHQIA